VLASSATEFPNGVWFVELADLQQPDLVISRVAAALGVSEEPGRPLLETLAEVLRRRRLLAFATLAVRGKQPERAVQLAAAAAALRESAGCRCSRPPGPKPALLPRAISVRPLSPGSGRRD
jgi:hypothetical protein